MLTTFNPRLEIGLPGRSGHGTEDEILEPRQLALFELPVTTCLSCSRVIPLGTAAFHLCMYLD